MKKNAILLFQAAQLGSKIHPFVISEVEEFCSCFDEVHLVCFKYSPSITELEKYKNLKVHQVNLISVKSIISSIMHFFTCYGLEDMMVAVRQKRFNIEYLKETARTLIFGNSILQSANKILKKASSLDKWIVEGYWLSGPAFAGAHLKRKYPHIFAFARAHSSEIDIVRNPYCICQYKKFIDKYIDEIYFISEWAKNNYETQIMPLHGICESGKNYVMRLGVNRKEHKMNKPSGDGVFRVLTCARAVELKRLDMLARAFADFDYPALVEWIHIGDGPELDKIKGICSRQKGNVKFTFKGDISNDEVHRYYATEPVDLFVNVSQYEGLPVSVMEAIAYGIPVVATSAGATCEIVNSSNGILLDVDIDEEVIYKTIVDMMKKSREELDAYREASYNLWQGKYNKSKNYNELFSKLKI